jgi:rsbT antagonist protein RsbS
MDAEGGVALVQVRNVLLATLPSDPEDGMIAGFQARVLGEFGRHAVRALVFDLSALEILDSFSTRILTETARMVVLMGGRCVLAGLRPPVAISMVQLGLVLPGVARALTVDLALDRLQRRPFRGEA